jgi:hypothetical protein
MTGLGCSKLSHGLSKDAWIKLETSSELVAVDPYNYETICGIRDFLTCERLLDRHDIFYFGKNSEYQLSLNTPGASPVTALLRLHSIDQSRTYSPITIRTRYESEMSRVRQ